VCLNSTPRRLSGDQICPPFVFIALQIPFLRNPFRCTSIQRGCATPPCSFPRTIRGDRRRTQIELRHLGPERAMTLNPNLLSVTMVCSLGGTLMCLPQTPLRASFSAQIYILFVDKRQTEIMLGAPRSLSKVTKPELWLALNATQYH
jgi:hypothetical protein